MNKKPKIIIAFYELSGYASREQLRGILRYERLHSLWDFVLDYHSYGSTFLTRADFDHVVGYIGEERPKISDALVEKNVPCVFFDPSPEYLETISGYSRYAVVECDGRLTGKLGARHFLERKYKNFAFVDVFDVLDNASTNYWSSERKRGFVEELEKSGHPCHFFDRRATSPERIQLLLQEWIFKLPKPIGIMVATDQRAVWILQVCIQLNLSVPDQVAVLGVDNDELLCKSSNPPLSSVSVANFESGMLAAELLDDLIKNKIRKPRTVQYKPISIISRRSTDAAWFDDMLVNSVNKKIWSVNGCNISVKEIAEQFAVSRRFLEMRFKACTGHSLMDVIQDVRIRYICSLLMQSELSLTDIVGISGFGSQGYLSQFFKKMTGVTMREYREKTK